MPLYLSPDSLEWALKHIEKYGDTDVFPMPFEYQAIRWSWDDIRDFLSSQDLYNYVVRPHRRCLSPKHRFGFRISTQLDPFDTLLYLALTYEIGEDIESKRIPPEAQIVFGYRFNPDEHGRIFDTEMDYDAFRRRSAELADTEKYSWVLVADIADFFPRIYTHPLENALTTCTRKLDHAKVIAKLIKKWNHSVSYGIPVGQTASRLVAELTISDVDQTLLSEGKVYCRFSDDFRLFFNDKKCAYEGLALLANTLFENHGLTLQQDKTEILDVDEFCRKYLQTERWAEHDSLSERFRDILEDIGIDDPYEEIEYDDLEPDVQEQIDSLNLQEILNEQINLGERIDYSLTRFVLRRLGQINDHAGIPLVFKNIELLYPIFKDVLGYISEIRKIAPGLRHRIGNNLIGLLENSIVGHLPYHKCWILNIFTHDREWDNEKKFQGLYSSIHDEFSRRELISAMGRSGQDYWFKSHKRNLSQFGPWEKRAFISAASCLPGDEAKHWYASINPSLDKLERSVIVWAKNNPYS
jgi:hypothetical protein